MDTKEKWATTDVDLFFLPEERQRAADRRAVFLRTTHPELFPTLDCAPFNDSERMKQLIDDLKRLHYFVQGEVSITEIDPSLIPRSTER